MTHTLHEQYQSSKDKNTFPDFLINELGFSFSLTNPDELVLKKGNPTIYQLNGFKVYDSSGVNYIDNNVGSYDSQNVYFHNSSDLSVRYFCSSNGSPLVCAEDINGDWTFITGYGMFCGNNSKILNSIITTFDNSKTIDSNSIYTLTKAARPDNGVPFKGLYIVTSAQFFKPHETLININGDIYRLVSLAPFNSDTQYPALAFKVSDE